MQAHDDRRDRKVLAAPLILDLFAGPGGWSEALRALGLADVGIEWDQRACETRRAAGHLTIRADVASYPVEPFIGKVVGLIASPPCPTFSAAGSGEGIDELMHLHSFATTVAHNGWFDPLSHHEWSDPRTPLVLEPLRWVEALDPEWVALEQVPGVLPLWEQYAAIWRTQGYSTWAGVLNAADFGVPQTRKRAFCIAHRGRPVGPPVPTHCKGGSETLWGELLPWVSMAEALGWGMTERPMTTVTTGGADTGGADPLLVGGSGARRTIEREREREVGSHRATAAWGNEDDERTCDDDHGECRQRQLPVAYRRTRGEGMNERHGERRDHPVDEPAPTLTSKARSDVWVVDRRTNSKAAGGGHGSYGGGADV